MARQIKKKIPKALREAVWVHHNGRKFESKCMTPWCPNIITVFDFQTSHDVPESKGGPTTLDNLFPLCGRCNLSMGSQYTFKEWSAGPGSPKKPTLFRRFLRCFTGSKSTTVVPAVSLEQPMPTNPLESVHGKSPKYPVLLKGSS